MLLTLVIFIVILAILILSHELGHFLAARSQGIKVEEFGFGYPPRLFGIQVFQTVKLKKIAEQEEVVITENAIVDEVQEIDKIVSKRKWRLVWGGKAIEDLEKENAGQASTVYSINLLPLGGFCKIKGEEGDFSGASDSYDNKKPWQKVMVMLGGVVMNVLLAVVLLSIGYVVGLPEMIDNMADVSQVKDRKLEIVAVLPDKPAFKAGLESGDAIVKIDSIDHPRLRELINYMNAHKNTPVRVTVARGDVTITKDIKPEIYVDTGKGGIGIAISETGIVKYPWYQAIYYGVVETGLYLKAILVAFYYFFQGLFSGAGVGGAVTGPVGIAVMTGRVARLGLAYLIQFTAVLSLNLAIINALPLPALDGGRVLFLFINKIRGRPISQRIENIIHTVGFNLLLLLVLLVTIKDISVFRGAFINLFNRIF